MKPIVTKEQLVKQFDLVDQPGSIIEFIDVDRGRMIVWDNPTKNPQVFRLDGQRRFNPRGFLPGTREELIDIFCCVAFPTAAAGFKMTAEASRSDPDPFINQIGTAASVFYSAVSAYPITYYLEKIARRAFPTRRTWIEIGTDRSRT